jgi:hypothetical protein
MDRGSRISIDAMADVPISDISHVIQLAIAPVFLLTGVGP